MPESALGAVEARFADLIWEHAPLSSRELVELAGRELGWKKSTTYTVLKKLCSRGLFRNVDSTVSVLVSREEYYGRQGRQFVQEAFHGSLPRFLAAFAGTEKLSEGDIAALEALIRQQRGE